MNLRVSQCSKFLYLVIGLVATVSILFGISIKGYADENFVETEVNIESLKKYLYNENEKIYFDVSKAEQYGESEFILEIGNTYNLLAKLDDSTTEGKRRVVHAISIPIYGNYCGPGTDFNNAGNPKDQLDKYCMYHDLCYGARGWGNKQCDKEFVANLKTGLRNGTIKGTWAKTVANAAILYFS